MTDEQSRWTAQRSVEVAQLFERLSAPEIEPDEHRAIREQIIEANLPLARYLARRLSARHGSPEDLSQVASVGLIKAVDRFDPALGHAFASYAAPLILGEIKRYLRDAASLVRAPRRAHELRGAVLEARDALNQRLGRSPMISEIAALIGATPEEVVETIEVDRGRDAQPLDVLTAPRTGAMQRLVAVDEGGYGSAETRADLNEALAVLTEQERLAISLRFEEGKTQVEIAAVLGVSKMQISRLLRRSLAKMRLVLES